MKYLVSTGRMHGFESLEERRLLMVLDFVTGGVTEVLAQPFRLDFTWRDGTGRHIPDFLALVAGGVLLLDVRPAHLIKEDDAVKFAATAQAAAAVGWRYVVVSGWRRQVVTVIDALSARRRPLSDPLALQALMSDLVAERPRLLVELVDEAPFPAVARVHLLHLLWHRRLAVDLTQPLGDGSWIYPVGSG
ncbi:hypothetical protein ABH931_005379 [Streptacidiphilus sp. MAP12-33]|uniref:TnsA-like heteromeric transposase endonuclease subunit n=1 Tax=Streptacidiphilus sp. MAP12-33 TaxID=3156266 RepID=UPI00351621B2